MTVTIATSTGYRRLLDHAGPLTWCAHVEALLERSARDVDAALLRTDAGDDLRASVADVCALRELGSDEAFYAQQQLLARLLALHTTLDAPRYAVRGERSVTLAEILRMLEDATLAAEDAQLVPADLDAIPAAGFVPWLKDRVRRHPAFKHAYYHDFIRSEATPVDLRRYLVQESVVDGRFDDLLALLQLGTDGATKLEIAENYWDEMGNGDAAQVHTLMFSRAMTALAVTDVEMREEMSAEGLLSGNLAMLLCRYRETYPEAVGFLAVTEWLVPDRFSQVLAGWNRLGLDPAGIEYHDAHIAIDARHASGWFNNVVKPGADSPSFRRGVTRGALWRLNSSARYLDANLARARR